MLVTIQESQGTFRIIIRIPNGKRILPPSILRPPLLDFEPADSRLLLLTSLWRLISDGRDSNFGWSVNWTCAWYIAPPNRLKGLEFSMLCKPLTRTTCKLLSPIYLTEGRGLNSIGILWPLGLFGGAMDQALWPSKRTSQSSNPVRWVSKDWSTTEDENRRVRNQAEVVGGCKEQKCVGR